jgi:hypothetical protein
MLNFVQSSLGDGEVAALGTTMTRLTAKALMYLVLAPTTHQLPSHTPLRRAGIDLIGRNHSSRREPGLFLLSSDLGRIRTLPLMKNPSSLLKFTYATDAVLLFFCVCVGGGT